MWWYNKKTNKRKYGLWITNWIILRVKQRNYFNKTDKWKNKIFNSKKELNSTNTNCKINKSSCRNYFTSTKSKNFTSKN